MAEILFNNEGVPLVGFSSRHFFSTIGGPLSKAKEGPSTPIQDNDNLIVLAGNEKAKISPWGSNNDFPIVAEKKITSSVVLWSGLKYKLQLFMGQGIFPCKVTGFDESGNETLEILSDTLLKNFVRSRMVRRYLQNSYRDVLKYGITFPEFIFNGDASKIVGINTINARHCRFLEAKDGIIRSLVTSAKFTSPDGNTSGTPAEQKDYKLLSVLDSYDPDADLERLRLSRSLSGNNFVYPIGNYFSNNDYYPTPDWLTASNAGWFDISSKIPEFLKNVYNNQISWLWHVKIPYAYWERRYPPTLYKVQKEREALIQADMDLIELNLTGTEAARKAIFTMFEVNNSGKPEEQWVIESLDNKYKSDQQMIESAVADSNILFSIGVNPTVMGAGLPGAGPYAGKTGGSDIRESFLVNVTLAWLDRQNILDPLETMLAFNGIQDVELRFRNTILTTLDQGKGTQKIVS